MQGRRRRGRDLSGPEVSRRRVLAFLGLELPAAYAALRSSGPPPALTSTPAGHDDHMSMGHSSREAPTLLLDGHFQNPYPDESLTPDELRMRAMIRIVQHGISVVPLQLQPPADLSSPLAARRTIATLVNVAETTEVPGAAFLQFLQPVHGQYHSTAKGRTMRSFITFHHELVKALDHLQLRRPLNVPEITAEEMRILQIGDPRRLPEPKSWSQFSKNLTSLYRWHMADDGPHVQMNKTVLDPNLDAWDSEVDTLTPQFWVIHSLMDEAFVNQLRGVLKFDPAHRGANVEQLVDEIDADRLPQLTHGR